MSHELYRPASRLSILQGHRCPIKHAPTACSAARSRSSRPVCASPRARSRCTARSARRGRRSARSRRTPASAARPSTATSPTRRRCSTPAPRTGRPPTRPPTWAPGRRSRAPTSACASALGELYAFYRRTEAMLDNLFRDEVTVPLVQERFAALPRLPRGGARHAHGGPQRCEAPPANARAPRSDTRSPKTDSGKNSHGCRRTTSPPAESPRGAGRRGWRRGRSSAPARRGRPDGRASARSGTDDDGVGQRGASPKARGGRQHVNVRPDRTTPGHVDVHSSSTGSAHRQLAARAAGRARRRARSAKHR